MGFFNKFLHKKPGKDEVAPRTTDIQSATSQDSTAPVTAESGLPQLPPGMETHKNGIIPELPELPSFENHPELHIDDAPDRIQGLDDFPSKITANSTDPAQDAGMLPDLPPMQPEESQTSIPSDPQAAIDNMPSLDTPPDLPEMPDFPKNTFGSNIESDVDSDSPLQTPTSPSAPTAPTAQMTPALDELKRQDEVTVTDKKESSEKPLFIDSETYAEILRDLVIAKQDLSHIHEHSKSSDFEKKVDSVLVKFKESVTDMKNNVVAAEQKLFEKVTP